MTAVDTGAVAGWVREGGPRHALLLHGGPGLGYEYLDALADEIGPAWSVASFQQRGLAPSTLDGPFDIATAVADIAAFLDALGWDRAVLVGHSWGGHLALHAAVAIPDRFVGVLGVDPLGAVGDGGQQEFAEALTARIPADDLARLADAADSVEALRILWPGYAANPADPPPFPGVRISDEVSDALWVDIRARMGALAAALADLAVPVGIVTGGAGPMPATAASDIVEVVPDAWLEVVDGAGHFPWLERPGCVGAALDRLMA
ncbi:MULTISPECIES: alpha/beta fold hydrolase [unclassified Nocardioides]|uniref:alpha/beta fold hydrolase n=1 Tax=unclassified Nocardioides TaxID=2615069 RepID=UPI0009F079B0|nr:MULTISPECIES: alpha/beta hydrolase [unclassified Nocardioides]GAW52058.1 Alpha/beta hydrolase fold protein [Nocardioides sp. PD653-B2]GAW57211.1 Alpha/beta hydrolase fold protein [Nocardioides sp. PD653]